MKYKCLSIAGFDGSGGAGIQADLKTFSALRCYGTTVLTALPIQNTCGVRNCFDLPLAAIQEQLDCIFEDITPDSIKIGMLFSRPIIELVSAFLVKHAKNIPIVLDPVMVAKSGHSLLLPDAIETLKSTLIPLATIITPNLPEAYRLVGETKDIEALGESLLRLGAKAILLKGGHADGVNSNDLFLDQHGNKRSFEAPRIDSRNTHGTGCTLSAAICAYLSRGESLIDACHLAKTYLFEAILAAKDHSVGKGHGSVHHFHAFYRI
ncbi:MAG: bifunctional hydroxymethylpyrimidine kinase/phosphomethylpyrimidine kinase [Legionellales bacterium]|nr:bifunctional hydroxymethylpyrimidine kinase/phosphomethylpyrimidine kinase [Legionellales bacterium]